MDIKIRHAVAEDYRALHAIYTQPKAYSGTLQLPFASPELWKKRLELPRENGATLVACNDAEVVGSIGFSIASQIRRRHTAGIGMGVHDKWQSQGVGSKLLAALIDLTDNWYNLSRLELTVFVDNEAAIALYKKAGFELEGTLRQFAFRDGQYIDAYSMARLSIKR